MPDYYKDLPPLDIKYTPQQIAKELQDTAEGNSHYGNALRVAKDFDCLSAEDRSTLDAYLTGRETSKDCFRLQDIVIKINAL